MVIAEFIQPINDALHSIALSLPRILTCFLIVPVLSGKNLHGLMRVAVGIGVGLPVAVGIFHQQGLVDVTAMQMFALFFKEAVIGLLMGFFLAIPFWVFEAIGTVFDTQRGAMMGQQLNPETGSMSSITGILLQQASVILMIELGAFAWLFGLLIDSYVLWPAMAFLPTPEAGANGFVISEFARMGSTFVLYALPLILTLLFIELIFALVGVYSPQLQVYFLAMPAKSLAGLIVLVLYASMLWKYGEVMFFDMKEADHLLERVFPSFVEGKS